jgi:hypothetical protein
MTDSKCLVTLQKALDNHPLPPDFNDPTFVYAEHKSRDALTSEYGYAIKAWFENFELFSALQKDCEKLERDLVAYRERDRVLEQTFVLVDRKQLSDMVKEFEKDGTAFLQKYGYCQIKKLLELSKKKVDVVEEMDKFERNESLEEGSK